MPGSLYILIILLITLLLAFKFRRHKIAFYAIIVAAVLGLVVYMVLLNKALGTM